MARSTPAQNDRGPASSTCRSPAAAAHRSSTGPTARSERSAASPPVTVRGCSSVWPAMSEMARITATGRPAAAAASGADSMSAATAPPRARRPRSASLTR